jgi:CRP-like cAMP-binding protein
MAATSDLAVHNRLLAALPRDVLDHLRPHLESVSLPLKHVIYDAGEPIEHIHFPNSGMVSLLILLEDGAVIEVGVIGNEGLLGVPALFGAATAPHQAMVQMPVEAMRLRTSLMREAMQRSPAVLERVMRYSQALQIQVSQTAVCNAHHELQERLARWLLMAHDRAPNDVLPLTQEFLSMMLGARRPSVTVAAHTLHEAGAIIYTRGVITVANRERLEDAACECYRAVQEKIEPLLGA